MPAGKHTAERPSNFHGRLTLGSHSHDSISASFLHGHQRPLDDLWRYFDEASTNSLHATWGGVGSASPETETWPHQLDKDLPRRQASCVQLRCEEVEGGGGAYPLKAVGFALAEAFRKAVDSPGLRGPEQSERLLSRVLVLVASL